MPYASAEQRRAYQVAYRASPKGQAAQKERARTRVYTPEQKAKRDETARAYAASEAGRAAQKKYAAKPTSKLKARERDARYRQTGRGKTRTARWLARPENAATQKAATARWHASERGRASAIAHMHMRRAAGEISPEDTAELRKATICYYCGTGIEAQRKGRAQPPAYATTIDHMVPIALGGTNARANLVAACLACNLRKGALPADDFIQSGRQYR